MIIGEFTFLEFLNLTQLESTAAADTTILDF